LLRGLVPHIDIGNKCYGYVLRVNFSHM